MEASGIKFRFDVWFKILQMGHTVKDMSVKEDFDMKKKAIDKISYGLFIVTAKEGKKDNGCIINTVMQATAIPNQVLVCVNKETATHDMIKATGMLNVSVLTQNANFELYKHFGYQSGKDVDKFASFHKCKRGKNELYYITEGTNAYISVSVTKMEDMGTHTLFIGKVTDMEILSEEPSVTYEYYLSKIKPKPEASQNTKDGQTVWRCIICGYEYVGEELPEDYICPLCKHPASDFEKIEN